MVPAKLKVHFAFFPYGGCGGTAQEHPSIRSWWGEMTPKLLADERVEGFTYLDYVDTPITMTRNAAVIDAQKLGADLIMMVDSDQNPNLYVGQDPRAKPFWESSFDFLYERHRQGKATVNSWTEYLWVDASTYLPLHDVTSFGPPGAVSHAVDALPEPARARILAALEL